MPDGPLFCWLGGLKITTVETTVTRSNTLNYLKHFLSLAVFSAFLLSARASYADTITGSSVNGDSFNLTVMLSPDQAGVFFIQTVSGTTTINGVTQAVKSIISTSAPGALTYTVDGYFNFDNLLFMGGGNAFDSPGLAFTLVDGTEVNLFYNDDTPGSGLVYENNGYNSMIASLAIASTPEPSGLMLLGTGMLGMAGVMRCRFKQ